MSQVDPQPTDLAWEKEKEINHRINLVDFQTLFIAVNLIFTARRRMQLHSLNTLPSNGTICGSIDLVLLVVIN